MRSAVLVVVMVSIDGLIQSPARGCAPPTTITLRALGKRSCGRNPSGASSAKAAASAMPHTWAPNEMALRLISSSREITGLGASIWVGTVEAQNVKSQTQEDELVL